MDITDLIKKLDDLLLGGNCPILGILDITL